MWEEHPECQKQQAKMIGVLVVFTIILYIGYAIKERDWDLLRQVLLYSGALIISLGLLSGTAWLFVKILTRLKKHEPRGDRIRETD